MPTTPAQLLLDVISTVNLQQTWEEALIFEKLGFNWGTLPLAAGEHVIALQQPYAAGDLGYNIFANVFTSTGGPSEDIGFRIKEKNVGNFKIWVSDTCIFSYFAFNPKIAVAQ